MRAVFGVLSLLIVVLIVGLLVKKQLSPAPVKVAPAEAGVSLPALAEGATPQQQSQQMQQQVRQQLESTLQRARPMPDEK